MWRRRLLPAVLGLIIVLALAAIRVADPYPTQALRDIAFDNYQRLAPRISTEQPVRIVDIDEASLAAVGQWPWPRNVLAKLATQLTAMGAAAVVFDVIFPEPDRMSPRMLVEDMKADPRFADLLTGDNGALADFDEEFAAALGASPSVLGFGDGQVTGGAPLTDPRSGFAVVGGDPTKTVPDIKAAVSSLPILVNAAKGLGSISLDPNGSASAVRRLPMLWTNGTKLFPSLALESLRIALGTSTIVVFSDTTEQGNGIQSVRVANFEVPTAADGSLWLYYHPSDPKLYVPAMDILGPDFAKDADLIAGHIVLIGTSATGLIDIRGTTLGTSMPGVEIHAQALEQILSQTFLTRSDWVGGLEILAFVLIGITVVFVILWSGPLICFIVGAILATIVVGASWLAFTRLGWLIDPSFPLAGSFVVYSAMIFLQFTIADADKRTIRRAFGHYVAPALLTEIEKSSDRLKLGGEMRELSVMFLDIRNFTTLSEGFEPAQLVGLLNTLFGELGARITNHYGTIDKFIGDAIMAFWNAPVDVPGHPRRACLAALEMRKALHDLNETDAFRLKAEGRAMKEIAIGIGISTGEALVGNLGLETRFDYSCIGDTVNVASRVEGACKTVGYDILVVDSTRNDVPDLAFLDAGALALKGKSARARIHVLIGGPELASSPAFAELEEAHRKVVAELEDGSEANADIDHCIELAKSVDPHLEKFYGALRARREDFPARAAA